MCEGGARQRGLVDGFLRHGLANVPRKHRLGDGFLMPLSLADRRTPVHMAVPQLPSEFVTEALWDYWSVQL